MNLGWLFSWVAIGYILLTLFEQPLWCIRAETLGQDYCHNNPYYPMTIQYTLSRWIAFWIEIAICSILCFEVILLLIAIRSRFFSSKIYIFNLVFLSMMIIDIVYAYSTPRSWLRFGPFLRVFIFANRSRDVRKQLRLLLKLVPRFGALCLVMFLFLTLFAFIGTLLFHGENREQKYFKTMTESLWSLLVLMTTCNFPDIMIGAFNQNRTAFVFFLIYLVISVFFLVNLVVAVIYNVYTEQDDKEQIRALQDTEDHLHQAFHLLDAQNVGYLTKQQFYDLVDQMRRFRNLAPFIDVEHVNLVFAALDNDATGTLSLLNFMQLCTVLHVKFERVEEETFLERTYPRLFKSLFFMSFKEIITSLYYEWIMQGVLIIMAGFTILESWDDLQGNTPSQKRTDRTPDSLWNWVEIVFTVVFILEALVKILVYGWNKYWCLCEFEFIVTVLSSLITIVVYIPNNVNDTVWIRYTQLLRLLGLLRMLRFISLPSVLRLMRLLTTISHFKIFYATFLSMIPSIAKSAKILFTVMFLFSALGVQLFGGKINLDPNNRYYILLKQKAPDYVNYNYECMNMNDMIGAMITMFQLLVLNNWMVFVEAYVAVSNKWARWFFITYYAIGVVGIMNIVVATVIDSFLKEYQNYQVEMVSQGEASIRGGEALFDAEYITGTRTGMYGKYRAVLQGYQDSRARSEKLLRMFERVENEQRQHLERQLSQRTSTLDDSIVHMQITQDSSGQGSSTVKQESLSRGLSRSATIERYLDQPVQRCQSVE